MLKAQRSRVDWIGVLEGCRMQCDSDRQKRVNTDFFRTWNTYTALKHTEISVRNENSYIFGLSLRSRSLLANEEPFSLELRKLILPKMK